MGRKIVPIPKFWNIRIPAEFPEGWGDYEIITTSHPRFKEVREERPAVGVVIPTYGGSINSTISTALVVGAMNLRLIFADRSGTYIAKNRNDIIRHMLAMEDVPVKYILMIDSDMVLDPHFIPQIVGRAEALGAPVLSGAYMKKGKGEPCFGVDSHTDYVEDRPWGHKWFKYQQWEWGDIIEAHWTGFGGILVRREVFELIQFPYMIDYYRNPDLFIGEDIDFCRYCRTLSIPILVDTGLPMGHYGNTQPCPNQQFVTVEDLARRQQEAQAHMQASAGGTASEGSSHAVPSGQWARYATDNIDGGANFGPDGVGAVGIDPGRVCTPEGNPGDNGSKVSVGGGTPGTAEGCGLVSLPLVAGRP